MNHHGLYFISLPTQEEVDFVAWRCTTNLQNYLLPLSLEDVSTADKPHPKWFSSVQFNKKKNVLI